MCKELLKCGAIGDKEVIISGGFPEMTTCMSIKSNCDLTSLCVNHEEADTRISLHASHAKAQEY